MRYQLPVIVWALLIFASSSIPSSDFPRINIPNLDKVVHFIYYFLLCFLTYRAVKHQDRFPLLSRYSVVFSFLVTVLYGASDETHQLFVPGRSADVVDLLFDMAGGSFALLVITIHDKFHSERRPAPAEGEAR